MPKMGLATTNSNTNAPVGAEGASGRDLLTVRESSSRQSATLSTRQQKKEMVSRH
jgi:hypothetical protein